MTSACSRSPYAKTPDSEPPTPSSARGGDWELGVGSWEFFSLEAHAESDLHRAAARLARVRPDEVAARSRFSEVRTLHVTGRDAVGVERAGRVGTHGPVPRDLLLVVEQVIDLELHPWLDRLPHRHVVGRRQVHDAVA